MERQPDESDLEIAAIKAELRQLSWFVRYTEWPSGHQVVLHARSDTSRHVVTEWHRTERDAWREALRLAVEAAPRPNDEPEPWQPPAPVA